MPTQTRLLLDAHEDEVWHLAFSHCGGFLASASKDRSVMIWSLHSLPRVRHHLKDHTEAVSYVAWSHDDRYAHPLHVCTCVYSVLHTYILCCMESWRQVCAPPPSFPPCTHLVSACSKIRCNATAGARCRVRVMYHVIACSIRYCTML